MNTENTEKLMTLSEIEELKLVANNHYESGKFNEAIQVTLKIIDIAEKAQLYSVAREQGLFVAEIYKKIQDKNKLSSILNEFNDLNKTILRINDIIPNDHDLKNHWDDFCNSNMEKYLSGLLYPSTAAPIIRQLSLLEKSYYKNKMLILEDYLNCLSNREVIKSILKSHRKK